MKRIWFYLLETSNDDSDLSDVASCCKYKHSVDDIFDGKRVKFVAETAGKRRGLVQGGQV